MGSPFTSARNGLWDASDVDTWGQGAGVYPQTAADVVTIAAGYTVTYNKVSTVELGAMSITGILTFLNSMSTKLTMSHNDITVNNGGELRVGASGAIIPKTYTAELIWNTTADNAKGINLAAGGKLTVYGDPDYFGSDYDTTLVSSSGAVPAAGNAITITVAGDFTTKWIAGQELLMHKGGTYANLTNDFCRLAITSVSANGSNTDVACTVTERPAALTCAIGADVLNLSRNVMFYKLGYNANLGQLNTLRPRLSNSNAIGTSNINVHDVSFGGWYGVYNGNNFIFDGVIRNGYRMVGSKCTISGILMAFNDPCYAPLIDCAINCYIVNTVNAYNGGQGGSLSGKVYGCTNGVDGPMNRVSAHIYSCNKGIRGGQDGIFTGNLGYNAAGIAMANTYDLDFATSGIFGIGAMTSLKLLNSQIPSLAINNRNSLSLIGRFKFEHYQQIANAHYIADAYGDIYKVAADGSGDNPSQRSGGGAEVLEVVPQSNCAANSYLELLNVRLWAAAGVSKTYRFYVQTDFATLPTAELKLYGEYLDAGSGGHLATVSSVQDITTRANAADWSQYVEVTINPAQDGYVNLYIRLMGYESSKKVWIDPKVAITGGDAVTVTPRWSYGDVQLDIDPVGGGGVFPIIGGSHIIQPARAA